MSMRTFSGLLVALGLAACGSGEKHDPVAAAPEDARIECAVGPGALARDCVVERDGATIVIRHRGGGFRRFTVAEDGTPSAADGADPVVATPLADGRVELAIGGDRFRLPGK